MLSLHEEVRVADAGEDGREPEEEGEAGQHVEGDHQHDGQLVRATVAVEFRALKETGKVATYRHVYQAEPKEPT